MAVSEGASVRRDGGLWSSGVTSSQSYNFTFVSITYKYTSQAVQPDLGHPGQG